MVKAAWVDKNGLKKGAWSEEEDQKLRAYILKYGHWNWRLLPKYAGLDRCGKSCRLRWVNYLKPGVKRGNFTKEEADLIKKLHDEFGNKWSDIAEKLPGRTDNDIKNYWHTHLEKRSKKCSKSGQREQQSSEITHCKNFQNPPQKLGSSKEEKCEVSSNMYILESSSSCSSGISGAFNWDLNLPAEQNCSDMF